MGPKKIHDGIFLIGDSNLTDSRDCCIYLIDLGNEQIVIDAGAGLSIPSLIDNIRSVIQRPSVSTIILTHCHIDHVGGASALRDHYGSDLVMHESDAPPVERGDRVVTAAQWYGINFQPLRIDRKMTGSEERLYYGNHQLVLVHTPGHTPGSISVYCDIAGKRVLFGQDIHGPFLKDFGANMADWTKSMKTLIALNADILCEGHFGVYHPNKKVTSYIERYLEEYGEDDSY